MFRSIKPALVPAVLVIFSIGFSACQDRGYIAGSRGMVLEPTSGLQIGVKSAEQIHHTFSSLTGVPITNNTVGNAFNNLRTQLPATSQLASFQASNQIAITKLAAEYCDLLVGNATLRTVVWPTFSFDQNPSQALSNASKKEALIQQTTIRFWGARLGNLPTLQDYRSELSALIDELLVDAPNSQSGTQNLVKGVCATVLAASPVTLL